MPSLSAREIANTYQLEMKAFEGRLEFFFKNGLEQPTPNEVVKVAKTLVQLFKEAGINCVAQIKVTPILVQATFDLPESEINFRDVITSELPKVCAELVQQKLDKRKFGMEILITSPEDNEKNWGPFRSKIDPIINSVVGELMGRPVQTHPAYEPA